MTDELFDDLFLDTISGATAVAVDDEPEPVEPIAMTGPAAMVFDIETGPVDSATLEDMFEFDESRVKGFELIGQAFDQKGVKIGNLKDKQKIAEKIEQKKQEHAQAVAEAMIAVAGAREEAWISFCERAPLSPLTGQVLAIGYSDGTAANTVVDCRESELHDERGIVNNFWIVVLNAISNGGRLVGHNIYGFDLPFLVRRSWLLGVEIPSQAYNLSGGRWSWNRLFVDTMTAWSCGVYGERISLDRAAQFFGTTRKNGEGAEFHRLFNGTPEERKQALDYLANDLVATHEVARKMGMV
jgi:hypothetical protein